MGAHGGFRHRRRSGRRGCLRRRTHSAQRLLAPGRCLRRMLLKTLQRCRATGRHARAMRHVVAATTGPDGGKLRLRWLLCFGGQHSATDDRCATE